MSTEIERRAYLKWENAGKPSGKDEEFWLEAEREVADLPCSGETCCLVGRWEPVKNLAVGETAYNVFKSLKSKIIKKLQ